MISFIEGTLVSYRERFIKDVNASFIRNIMQEFSSQAHIAGSQRNYELALQTQELWNSWGISTILDKIPVLLQYPITQKVQVTFPPEIAYTLTMEEAVINKNDK
jgi:hypothetical protein